MVEDITRKSHHGYPCFLDFDAFEVFETSTHIQSLSKAIMIWHYYPSYNDIGIKKGPSREMKLYVNLFCSNCVSWILSFWIIFSIFIRLFFAVRLFPVRTWPDEMTSCELICLIVHHRDRVQNPVYEEHARLKRKLNLPKKTVFRIWKCDFDFKQGIDESPLSTRFAFTSTTLENASISPLFSTTPVSPISELGFIYDF